jgi:hypothetical protein
MFHESKYFCCPVAGLGPVKTYLLLVFITGVNVKGLAA